MSPLITNGNIDFLIDRLAAVTARMDERGHAHIGWILNTYLDFADDEFKQEIGRQIGDITSPAVDAHLRDVFSADDAPATLPAPLAHVVDRLRQCPLHKKIVLARKWALEVRARHEWDRLLDETPDEFIDAIKQGLA